MHKTGVGFLCFFVLLVFVSCTLHQKDKPESRKETVKILEDHVKSRPDQAIKKCR